MRLTKHIQEDLGFDLYRTITIAICIASVAANFLILQRSSRAVNQQIDRSGASLVLQEDRANTERAFKALEETK